MKPNPLIKIFGKTILLAIVLFSISFLFLKEQYLFAVLLIPVVIWLVAEFYRFHKKSLLEVEEFVQSVHYRDFTRYFDVKHSPSELQMLRKGFNDINTTLKVISKEKETQYQYLQKILELVDTGILSYELESGTVVWMNESIKKLLQIPYLKSIQSLDKRYPALCAQVVEIKPGDAIISDIPVEHNNMKVLMSATAFQTEGKVYKLIAFQNINAAIDETESKAWQKLLRVMTHEIMNSVAPISSLAETLKNLLSQTKENVSPYNQNIFEDIVLGMDTIKRRSEGLLKFAQTFRNLNQITHLNLRKFYVRDLFENMLRLMMPSLQQKSIETEIILKDPDLQIEADIELLEQVCINLLLNAIEAVKESADPRIILVAAINNNKHPYIKIADNGSGIAPDVIDKIFIPFFSTKKSGGGIGLSLCKQIMMLHKGNINVQSSTETGTAFTLIF